MKMQDKNAVTLSIKKKIYDCRHLLMTREELLLKRGQIEKELLLLKTTDKNRFLKLKNELKELDHTLDQSEELSQADVEKLIEELLTHLEKEDPNEAESIVKQRIKQKEFVATKETLSFIIQGCTGLEACLTAIQTARRSLKGFGFLAYIFSVSPNIVIEHHLKIADKDSQALLSYLIHSENVKKLLDDYPERIESIKNLSLLLKELSEECAATWSFKHIDQKILKKLDLLKKSLHEFLQHLNAIEKEIKSTDLLFQ